MFRSKSPLPPHIQAIMTKITTFPTGPQILKKKDKAIEELVQVMSVDPSEEIGNILSCFYGQWDGILVATNKRLLFISQGFTGCRVDDYSYKHIHSLHYDGLGSGNISIITYGHRITWDKAELQAVKNFAYHLKAQMLANLSPS